MAYGYRPQRPGMIDPNDPRRKRIPLTPEEDLSLGIDPSFEVDLPAATPPLAIPQLPATPAPMAARQNQPPPPADLSEFRQWYSGATQIPGMPQPEWGKRTPTYSRLNPPPPKAGTGQLPGTMKPLPAGQAPAPPSLPPAMPGMQPARPPGMQQGPVRPAASMPSFTQTAGDQALERMQAQIPVPVSQPSRGAMLANMAPAPKATPLTDYRIPASEMRLPQVASTPATLAAPSGRALTPQEQQLKTEALLSELNFQSKLNRATPAEQKAQVAAERAQIPGSLGGQVASSVLTPFGSAESKQRMAQTGGQFLNRIGRGFGETLANVPMGIGASSPVAAEAIERDIAPVRNWLKTAFPTDAERNDFVNAALPEAIGSIGAFLAGSAVGGGTQLSAAMMGALVNAGSAYDEARQRGFSRENAIKAARLGRLIGTSEAFGIGRTLDKISQVRPNLARLLSAGEEGAQEVISQGLNNANAKIASGYDPERALTEGLDEAFEVGFGSGLFMEAIGMGIAGMSASRKGGANKVPDALQLEAGPKVAGLLGPSPLSEQQQRYQAMTGTGVPRAPKTFVPGVPSGVQGPGFIRRPAGGVTTNRPQGPEFNGRGLALPPAPGQDGQPETSTGTTPTTSTVPSTRATNLSGIQFKPGWAGARPVYAMDRPIVKTALERGPGTETAMAIEPQLARLQEEFESGASMADYEERLAKFNAGKLKKVPTPPSAPTAADVRFGGTEAGQVARNLNRSSTAVLKKVAPLYGVEEGTETAFEPVMEKITAEMSNLRGKPVTLEEARGAAMLGRKAEAQGKGDTALWTDWYNQYGKAKGIDKQQFTDLRNLAAGKVGFTFRPEIQEILLGYSGQPKANEEVMEVIREDMAKQMGLPYESISLTTIPPKAWSLWAQRRQIDRLAPEAYREMMEAVERSPRSLEMQEAATSKGTPKGKKGKPVTPPAAPVTPPPVTPSVTPPAPSRTTSLAERYQSQVARGIPGAPRSFVPGIPSRLQGPGFTRRPGNAATTGRPQGPPGIKGLLPPIGQEGQERQGAKTTRERLKARNPFARERQAEQGRVEGRKPPTPPEAVTPTPVTPTPPPTPTPTGQTVTPATPRTLAGRTAKPAPTTETVKITAKTLNARGWNQSGNGDWGNAAGEQVVRNERNTWTHVDRSGNKTQYPTLQEAFKSIFAEPAVEKTTPSAKTTKGKAVAVRNLKQVDVDFLESLAAKYGAPPRPIVEAEGQLGRISRASNMLERAADKSTSASELSQILDIAQRIKSGRAVISVAHNRAADTATFEKAAQDPEANKTVLPSYWEAIRTRRAERATPEKTTPSAKTTEGKAGKPARPKKEKEGSASVPNKTAASETPKRMPASPDFTLKSGESIPGPSEQLNGYVANMSPMQRGRIVAGLTKPRRVTQKLTTNADYLEKAIAAGAKIVTRPDGERRLVLPDDSFFIEKDFSKQAFDYGEYLMRKGVSAAPTPATTEQAVAEARKLMRELAAELNLPENLPLDKLVSAAQKKVREAEKAAPTTAATEVPTEVRQIFDTLDLPQGKKSKTRKIVEAMHPDLGKKAIFVNDNIEQIIAEAEASGKVTKECP